MEAQQLAEIAGLELSVAQEYLAAAGGVGEVALGLLFDDDAAQPPFPCGKGGGHRPREVRFVQSESNEERLAAERTVALVLMQLLDHHIR